MNLWVKRIGQLCMVAVLFFFSCEEDTSFLGFRKPKPFDVHFVEIPVNSSVFLSDSIITDNPATVGRLMVGQYMDNLLGKVNTEAFSEIYPSSTTILSETSVYDSITVQLRLDFYSYGISGTESLTFSIHEITGDTLTYFDGNRYYYNSPAPQYNPTALGEASAEVNYDSLKKQGGLQSGQDTILAQTRLDDEFGLRLFNLAKNNPDSAFSKSSLFRSQIKGLAIIPSMGDAIIGLNGNSSLSQVILHYHTVENSAVKDTLARSFTFSTPGGSRAFTKISVDRAGTDLAPIMMPYTSYAPDNGMRYIQNGSPVITKLDISQFYQLADTTENMIINSAELTIANIESPDGVSPHSAFALRLLRNDTSIFANINVAADTSLIRSLHFIADPNRDRYYYVRADFSAQDPRTFVVYNSDDKKYTGYLTLFFQSLFREKNATVRPRYLALYPYSPAPERSVERTAFQAGNVKLRIYYTIPTQPKP